jgi:hypothetical protein
MRGHFSEVKGVHRAEVRSPAHVHRDILLWSQVIVFE